MPGRLIPGGRGKLWCALTHACLAAGSLALCAGGADKPTSWRDINFKAKGKHYEQLCVHI